jgi:hypothetical protein
MGQSFYPINNTDFLAWLENFIDVARVNLASLNLTTDDITKLEGLRDDLRTKLTDKTAKQEAAVAATKALTESRRAADETVGYYNQIFKAGEDVHVNLLESLGLNPNEDHFTPVSGLHQWIWSSKVIRAASVM